MHFISSLGSAGIPLNPVEEARRDVAGRKVGRYKALSGKGRRSLQLGLTPFSCVSHFQVDTALVTKDTNCTWETKS